MDSSNPESVTSLPEPINTAMAETITAIRQFYKNEGKLGVLCQQHNMNWLPIVWALEASMADIEEDDLEYIDPEYRASSLAGMFLMVQRRMAECSDHSPPMVPHPRPNFNFSSNIFPGQRVLVRFVRNGSAFSRTDYSFTVLQRTIFLYHPLLNNCVYFGLTMRPIRVSVGIIHRS